MQHNKLFFTIFLSCLFSIFILTESRAQVVNGDVTLTTQTQVDAFDNVTTPITTITGNLTILGSDIANLTPLLSLESIGGDLIIGNKADVVLSTTENSNLENIYGLHNVETIGGGLIITRNPILININELESLKSIGGYLNISGNNNLTDLEGLQNVTSVMQQVEVFECPSLISIYGLRNVSSIESLYLQENNSLINLDGLENISAVVSGLRLVSNASLINIDKLSNVTSVLFTLTIETNDALSNLDGLTNLTKVGNLYISGNGVLSNIDGLENLATVDGYLVIDSHPLLNSFCGLYNLLNGDGLAGGYNVFNNGSNPTIEEIKEDCSSDSPEDLLAELITSVDLSSIHKGTKNSLTSSLDNALKSLGKGNTGAAINQLKAFTNKVEAQSGKKVDETTANEWIADAQEIIDAIQASLAKNGDGEEVTFNDIKPGTYSLNQNYPNPFNPTTSVSYSIPSDGYVTLSIYDALGKEVAVLDNGFRTAGNYSHTFDASALSSGMYFYTIRSGNFVQTKKMLLMK